MFRRESLSLLFLCLQVNSEFSAVRSGAPSRMVVIPPSLKPFLIFLFMLAPLNFLVKGAVALFDKLVFP